MLHTKSIIKNSFIRFSLVLLSMYICGCNNNCLAQQNDNCESFAINGIETFFKRVYSDNSKPNPTFIQFWFEYKIEIEEFVTWAHANGYETEIRKTVIITESAQADSKLTENENSLKIRKPIVSHDVRFFIDEIQAVGKEKKQLGIDMCGAISVQY